MAPIRYTGKFQRKNRDPREDAVQTYIDMAAARGRAKQPAYPQQQQVQTPGIGQILAGTAGASADTAASIVNRFPGWMRTAARGFGEALWSIPKSLDLEQYVQASQPGMAVRGAGKPTSQQLAKWYGKATPGMDYSYPFPQAVRVPPIPAGRTFAQAPRWKQEERENIDMGTRRLMPAYYDEQGRLVEVQPEMWPSRTGWIEAEKKLGRSLDVYERTLQTVGLQGEQLYPGYGAGGGYGGGYYPGYGGGGGYTPQAYRYQSGQPGGYAGPGTRTATGTGAGGGMNINYAAQRIPGYAPRLNIPRWLATMVNWRIG